MNENLLVENNSRFPSEIKRFYIPIRSLEKLIGAKIDGPVNSVGTGQDGIEISIPHPIFEKMLEEKYNDEIKSVKINGGKVTINLSEGENRKKEKPDKGAEVGNLKKFFGFFASG